MIERAIEAIERLAEAIHRLCDLANEILEADMGEEDGEPPPRPDKDSYAPKVIEARNL